MLDLQLYLVDIWELRITRLYDEIMQIATYIK